MRLTKGKKPGTINQWCWRTEANSIGRERTMPNINLTEKFESGIVAQLQSAPTMFGARVVADSTRDPSLG